MTASFVKPWLSSAAAALCAALALAGAACCTFPARDRAFEERISQFAKEAGPGSSIELFNGENLAGWSVHGLGAWSVEDGVLSVRRGIGYLATRCENWGDFILDLDIRVSEKGNSGVFFRASHPGIGLRPYPEGYEAQVDNHDPENPTGSLYDRAKASELLARDGEWFHMRIETTGGRHQVAVNGETVTDVTDTTFRSGLIALQAHDPFCRVDFKNIVLRLPE